MTRSKKPAAVWISSGAILAAIAALSAWAAMPPKLMDLEDLAPEVRAEIEGHPTLVGLKTSEEALRSFAESLIAAGAPTAHAPEPKEATQ